MTTDPQAEQRQQRVAALLRGGAPATPAGLRARIEADLARDGERRRLLRLPSMRVAVAAAVALVALAVVIPLGLKDDPLTVDQAVAPTHRDPVDPAPRRDAREPALLAASFAGVSYPDWRKEFGWQPVGARSDELQGRDAETVFYEHHGHQIGYTVVAGKPLGLPDKGVRVTRQGLAIQMYEAPDGHDVAMFERNGRTCVLAGHVKRRSTLAKLAAWRGDGAVKFSAAATTGA